MEYQFTNIEEKWLTAWEKSNLYKVTTDYSKPKYYVLDMFPYPSGSGLHVGHPLGYIASDIYSRYKRLSGFNVLHPMGFDAFGLPTEQYAIETGQHPLDTTEINISTFKRQLRKVGFSYDWDREFRTSDPGYYKWTQYMFLRLYHSWYNKDKRNAEGISELVARFEAFGHKNSELSESCPSFTSEEWNMMRASEKESILSHFRLAYQSYAEVNWCEALGTVLANDEVINGLSERGGHPVTKKKMRQWFLRITAYADRLLEGLETIDWPKPLKEMQKNWIGKSEGAEVKFEIENSSSNIEVFTTRPDTIFGVSFLVMAPEHPLLQSLVPDSHRSAVEDYILYVKSRSDIERQQNKQVSGIDTGIKAIHPYTKESLPVYTAEYVLYGYGTGSIMAVPAGDERDFAFATKFNLPIPEIFMEDGDADRESKNKKLKNSSFLDGLDYYAALPIILDNLNDSGFGKRKIQYKLRDAGFSRQRYWGEPIPVKYEDEVPIALSEEDLPVLLPMTNDFEPSADGKSPLSKIAEWQEKNLETDTMPGFAGSCWYFLRYMDPKNEERFVDANIESYWRQVDLYIGGAEHAVGHLLYSRFWHKVLFDLKLVSEEEPFKKLINQGMIQGRSSIVYRLVGSNLFVSKNLINGREITPIHVDVNMVQDDILDIHAFKNWREEFAQAEFELENGKYICGFEIEKMSKRWYNVVNPDDVIAAYGADCFRMYEMFLGPIEDSKPWNTQGIDGVSKFLRRLWRWLVTEQGTINWSEDTPSTDNLKILHKTIKKVTEDIDRLNLNTCVPAFMIALNELQNSPPNKNIAEPILILLAPFAPFITEEIWSMAGKTNSIHTETWPSWNEEFLIENTFEYPVSLNGKVRTKLSFHLETDESVMIDAVKNEESLKKYYEGKEIKKVIVVKGRIINVVV